MLYRVMTHSEEPSMPPKRDKLPDKELDVLKRWIAGGRLETANGKAAAAKKPKIDLSLAAVTNDRPAGPLPMPRGLVLESFVPRLAPGALDALASSPWAPVVAVGGQKQVLLYNPETCELLGIVPFPDGQPQVVAFSRSGQLLLIGGGQAAKSGKVVLWDITAGRRITEVGDEFDSVLAADISPDQSTVALGGPGKIGEALFDEGRATHPVDREEAHRLGQRHRVQRRRDAPRQRRPRRRASRLGGARRQRVLQPGGPQGGRDGRRLPPRFQPPGLGQRGRNDQALGHAERQGSAAPGRRTPAACCRSPSRATAVSISCGRDRLVKLWKPDGSPLKQLEPFNDIALRAVFDHDGQRAIAGDWTGEVRVWTVADGKRAGALASNPPPLSDRIDAATKRLDEAQPPRDRAAAELRAALDADALAATQFKAAEAAVPAAHAECESAQLRRSAADAEVHAATDLLKASREAPLPGRRTLSKRPTQRAKPAPHGKPRGEICRH